jgi:hypothetical protein
MADSKITQLTELATPANEDLLAIVDDPSGTPITKKVTVANVLSLAGGEKKVTAYPGDGVVESATFTVDGGGEVPVVLFADGSNNHMWHTTYRVPSSANGLTISSILIHYRYIGTTDRNLYLRFRVRKYPVASDSARVNDSDGPNTYATGTGTDTNHKIITVNSAAYNGISTLGTGDILVLTIDRQGADALDTYGQRFEVLMTEITFA